MPGAYCSSPGNCRIPSPHECCCRKISQCCMLAWLLSFTVLGTCGLQMCYWYNFFGFLTSVVSVSLSGTLFLYWTFWIDAPCFLTALCTFQLLVLLCYFVERFARLYLLYLQRKFWVHQLLELYVNTIWKFLKFSSELALSLFLTDSFFLIV